MARRKLLFNAWLCVLLSVSAASAEPIRMIDGARIRVADVATGAGEELREIDLGPAPPPGSSRLFARDAVLRELRSQGLDVSQLRVPATVRVQSAAKRWSATELILLLQPKIIAALPDGVSLKSAKLTRGIVTSPLVEVGSVRVPKLQRRVGAATLTATVDLLHEGAVCARVPVTLAVEVSASAAEPLIKKGARVELVIERGPARISATALALDDAEQDQIVAFKVNFTNRMLRARAVSRNRAVVVAP